MRINRRLRRLPKEPEVDTIEAILSGPTGFTPGQQAEISERLDGIFRRRWDAECEAFRSASVDDQAARKSVRRHYAN